jgi:hypothetical protein
LPDFDLADDGDLLTCRFVHGKVTKGYTFQVSDYPDTTVLIDDEDPVLLDGNLAKIFDKIVTGLYFAPPQTDTNAHQNALHWVIVFSVQTNWRSSVLPTDLFSKT